MPQPGRPRSSPMLLCWLAVAQRFFELLVWDVCALWYIRSSVSRVCRRPCSPAIPWLCVVGGGRRAGAMQDLLVGRSRNRGCCRSPWPPCGFVTPEISVGACHLPLLRCGGVLCPMQGVPLSARGSRPPGPLGSCRRASAPPARNGPLPASPLIGTEARATGHCSLSQAGGPQRLIVEVGASDPVPLKPGWISPLGGNKTRVLQRLAGHVGGSRRADQPRARVRPWDDACLTDAPGQDPGPPRPKMSASPSSRGNSP